MIERGHQFFADIETNQVSKDGLAVLRYLAARGEGCGCNRAELAQQFNASINLEVTLASLINRELLEERKEEYHFQVEAIRRWFAHTDSTQRMNSG